MSVVQRDRGVAPHLGSVAGGPVTGHDVAVRWAVPAALVGMGARGMASVEIAAAGDEDGRVGLRVTIVGESARREVRSVGPLDPGAWMSDGTGLEHIEAGPTLRATLRDGAVLFAQTDVMAELGLAGGRYERAV
jgi:hypothetical protein